MNTVIFSPYNRKSYSRGIMLDQLQQAMENKMTGDNIYYITCSNAFEVCYFNFEGKPDICYSCRINANKNLSLIDAGFIKLDFNDIIKQEDRKQAYDFFLQNPTVDFDTIFENFEIGEALLSVYISNTRSKNIDIANNSAYIFNAKVNTIALYLATKRFLKEKDINKVLSFNGRQDYVRAILRASQSVNIDCYNFERTRPGGFIEIYKNTIPHDIKARTEWIEKAWDDKSFTVDKKVKISSDFYYKKRNGEAVTDKSYTTSQRQGYIDENLQGLKNNFILFTSSDDEFAAVGKDFINPFFKDQLDGISYVVELMGRNFTNKNLIIRMHPNLKDVTENDAIGILKFHKKYENIYVIPPESTIDSYALLDISEKVIVFGSTIGVEANFWRKPVILLAKSLYWLLDVAYIPKDKEEINALLSSNLDAKDLTGSLKYGFYALNGGIKSKYYTQTSTRSAVMFKEKKLAEYSISTKIVAKLIAQIYKLFKVKLQMKWIK